MSIAPEFLTAKGRKEHREIHSLALCLCDFAVNLRAVIRNIIFDWSGTLVDDLPAVLKASNFVLTQSGKPKMSLEQFRVEFQLPFTKFYDRHTPHVPMPQLEEWFHAEFRRAQASVCELPHAREFLEFCRAHKIRMFLLSTIHGDHFKVQCGVTGFDVFIEKPYTDVWD